MPLFSRLTLVSSATFAAAIAFGSAPAQAGFLEFLFGGGYEQPRYSRPQPEPLDVRVNPRRKAPPRPVSANPDGKRVLAKSIDPVARPNWYLEDSTLRRGDIVVLKGEVLVYDGGRTPGSRAAFTSLQKSPLVSKGEKGRIERMADTSGPPAAEPVSVPNKEAKLATP